MKVYSNQILDSEWVIPFPDELHTTELDWWMIYDADTKTITIEPLQCFGYTSSPLTMVIADTYEALNQYIADHALIYPDYQ